MKAYILSTAPLAEDLIVRARERGIGIDAIPFISIKNVDEELVCEEARSLSKLKIAAVFTSANAVKAVVAMIGVEKPVWDVYCIGAATRDEAERHFGDDVIAGTADDAARLAEIIKGDNRGEVVFFCGDKRLGILPAILKDAGVSVREVVVYSMTEQPVAVSRVYEGVLFYSPSGVQSFFSTNTVDDKCILFAIGNTTAAALKAYNSNNELRISTIPSKAAMVADAIAYFNNEAIAG